MKADKKRATKKAIKQALTAASSGTSSSVKSVCASNEIEDTQTLAIIPVANLSSIRKQPARKKKASIPTEQDKQASDVGKKKKKAPSKKKGPPKKKGPEPSKKRKKAAAQPSTPSKKKKAATEEPSTPVNKKKNVALPDSPAMSTRSKLKLLRLPSLDSLRRACWRCTTRIIGFASRRPVRAVRPLVALPSHPELLLCMGAWRGIAASATSTRGWIIVEASEIHPLVQAFEFAALPVSRQSPACLLLLLVRPDARIRECHPAARLPTGGVRGLPSTGSCEDGMLLLPCSQK
ncbi:hypothetical protein EJB05_48242, partial [Eragrostis curvula]